jgi:hypothetical protein
MIAYEVRLNGEKVATAGVKHGGVLSVIANWISLQDGVARGASRDWEAGVSVGGLRGGRRGLDEYLTWFRKSLRVGDEVTLRLVETDRVDRPATIQRKRKRKT